MSARDTFRRLERERFAVSGRGAADRCRLAGALQAVADFHQGPSMHDELERLLEEVGAPPWLAAAFLAGYRACWE